MLNVTISLAENRAVPISRRPTHPADGGRFGDQRRPVVAGYRNRYAFTAVITGWRTTVQGSSMAGTLTYDLTLAGIPGVAGIQAQLTGVTRQ